jgi:hypothetical protein
MAVEGTESATVETPDVSTDILSNDTEAESTEQNEEVAPSESEAEEASSDAEPDAAKDKSDKSSEARATETAKQQAIELRKVKRELRQLRETQQQVRPIVQELKPPIRPKIDDYYQYDDFQDRFDKANAEHEQKLQAYAIEKDRREQAARSQTEAQEKQKQADAKEWNKRAAETAKRVPDFDLKTAYENAAPNQVMDGFIVDCEIGPDLLWHLAQNPELADEIREMKSPYQQVEKLIDLRNTLANQIKGIKPKATASKPVSGMKGSSAGPVKRKAPEDVLYG